MLDDGDMLLLRRQLRIWHLGPVSPSCQILNVKENTMKKRLSLPLMILVIFVVLAVSSCDLWYGIFGDPVVGTWKLTAETINGTVYTIGPGASEVSCTLTIAEEGTITGGGSMMGTAFTNTGTWTRDGTTYTLVIISSPGGTVTSTCTLSSDATTMTGTVDGSGITGSMSLAKQ
jgi:hypothetical protein